MPIISTAEVKTLLQLADNSKDSFLTADIPLVQQFIVDYCHNKFKVPDVFVVNGQLIFDASTNTITNDVDDFLYAGFKVGFDIIVEGSLNNDGIYTIKAVEQYKITLADSDLIVDESISDWVQWVRVSKVQFPIALKRTVSKMISYDMNKKVGQGLRSESLGDHSESYTEDYPKSILNELRPYRKVAW